MVKYFAGKHLSRLPLCIFLPSKLTDDVRIIHAQAVNMWDRVSKNGPKGSLPQILKAVFHKL